jgi:hypothetical protein
MKSLLIVLLISICAIAYRYEDVIGPLVGMNTTQRVQQVSVNDLLDRDTNGGQQGMSIHEFANLAKTDPDAYRKFLQSHQQPEERNEVDKLMNLLARGKYE